MLSAIPASGTPECPTNQGAVPYPNRASFNKHSKTSAGTVRTESKYELFRNDRKVKMMNTVCARHAAVSWQGGKYVASTQSLEKMEHSKK